MSILTTTVSDILDEIFNWLSSVVPAREPILSGDIDGPTPRLPYSAFRINQIANSQNPVVKLSTDGTAETIYQQAIFTVNVECIGDRKNGGSASQDLQTLAASLYGQRRYLDLWTISGFGGIQTQPQSLTTATLATNRTRWQMTFTIYANIELVTQDVDYIDAVPAQVIDGINDIIILDKTINGEPINGECD